MSIVFIVYEGFIVIILQSTWILQNASSKNQWNYMRQLSNSYFSKPSKHFFKCPYTCSTIYLATDSIWLNIHCCALSLPLSWKSVIKQFLHEQALSAIINFQCMRHCLSALSNKRISKNTCILGAPRPTRVSISYQNVTVCNNLHILEKAIR